jgi:hypothetical protein
MILYDLEIKHSILPKKKSEVISGIKYCKDWEDFQNMGISVVCAFDYSSSRLLSYSDDIPNLDGGLADFQSLVWSSDLVIGYNNIKFDDMVCRATGIDIPVDKSYDILRQIWHASGISNKFNKLTHSGFGLDAVAKANGVVETKLANGAEAPIWFQRGEYAKLVEYCMRDVLLTKRILDHIIDFGWLLHPKTQRKLKINKPMEMING